MQFLQLFIQSSRQRFDTRFLRLRPDHFGLGQTDVEHLLEFRVIDNGETNVLNPKNQSCSR